MRRYETFIILDPDLSEDGRAPVITRVKELISGHNGFLVLEDNWGNRKLAYEIKKKARGYYVRFDYCGDATLVNEMERFFRINDNVMKFMTVLLDKEIDLEKIKADVAEAEAEKKRAEEAAAAKAAEAAAAAEAEAKAEAERLAAAEAEAETPDTAETEVTEAESSDAADAGTPEAEVDTAAEAEPTPEASQEKTQEETEEEKK